MMKKRFAQILAISLSVMLLASGCKGGQSGSSAPAPGGAASDAPAGGEDKTSMIVAKQSDPSSLDPHTVTDEAAIRCIENMYDTLFAYTDVYGEVAPSLVTQYEVSDDGLIYTFSLRPGVKFHSGRDLTAADVVYSLRRIMDTGVRATQFDKIASMEEKDAGTVVITLSEPFAPFLTYLAHPMNVIVDKDVVEANGNSLAQVDGGSGPFVLEKWEMGSSLTMKKFPGYWKEGTPVLETVVFRTIPDATARSTALRNGEIDMILDVTEQEIAVLKNAAGVKVESVPGTFWEYLGMNCQNTFLKDVRVRRAIANAIDRDAINLSVKMGNATVLHDANIPATHEGYVNANTYPARDVDKAKALLAEAGYQPGQISLTLKVGSDFKYQVDAAQMIKQQLADAGIQVEISALESGIFFDSLNAGDFDLTVVGWSGFVDLDEYLYNLFYTGGAYNQQLYSNPELDKLLDEGRVTTDPAKRTEIYKQAQKLVAEDAPMAFLYMNNFTVAMRDNVEGFVVHPTATTISLQNAHFA